MMDLKVLGPLEARNGGFDLTPSAAKPRQVLALMALEAGNIVTVPALIDELWGTAPPRSALTTMQTYILQLRRGISTTVDAAEADSATEVGAKQLLVTRPNGYSLQVDPDAVDLRRYDRLAAAGSRAAQLGDNASASRLLREALGLWRGPALVDVEVGNRLSVELARLDESHLNALEQCIEAEMHLGRYRELLSELAELTARYPMHENMCGQYMIALYRAGRQWQALDEFSRLRAALIDELGVDPSARIQQLHQAILCSEPYLDEPDSGQQLVGQLAG